MFFPRRPSMMFSRMSAPNPKRSSNSRTNSRPGGDAGALEINFQTGVKREMKGLILFLTHRIEPP